MRETTHAQPSANGTLLSGSWPLFKDYDALQQKGYEESRKVNGEASLLENFLGALCDHDQTAADLRRDIFRTDEHGQYLHKQVDVSKADVKELQQEANKEEARSATAIKLREDEIFEKKIEIRRIRSGDYGLLGNDANPANRLAYFMCAVILGALSIYLILFYVSVIYNAFILDTAQAAQILAAEGSFSTLTIVNLDALPNIYYENGILGVLFLLSSSFMFIGLGFLIHWLTHRRSWAWLAGLYAFTLIFDGFLAYEIVKKIYESQIMVGIGENIPWSGLGMAMANGAFWIILFAGFSMYIIWGLLLRYLLDEYYKIIPARVAMRHRKAQIKRLREEIGSLKQEAAIRANAMRQEALKVEQQHIGKLNNDIEKNEKQLRDLRANLKNDLAKSGFSYHDMQNRIVPFFTGWCQYITEHYQEAAAPRVALCQQVLNNFYRKIGLN